MFRFANPQYLWLLLAVPALVALYWLAARNRRRRLARFGRPGICLLYTSDAADE